MEEKKKKFHIDEKDIVQNDLLAALYVVLTYILAPISFGVIQFRLSEILILTCFFDKKKAIGLTLGCLIANLVSPLGELGVMIVGYIIVMMLRRNKRLFKVFRASQNMDFKF